MTGAKPDYTLVYDGHCRVCTRFVGALEVWDRDRRVETASSHTPGVRERFPFIARAAFDDRVQLISGDGTVWSGAAALQRVVTAMPRGRWVGWVFALPFAERLYLLVARNRYRMGCTDHCRH